VFPLTLSKLTFDGSSCSLGLRKCKTWAQGPDLRTLAVVLELFNSRKLEGKLKGDEHQHKYLKLFVITQVVHIMELLSVLFIYRIKKVLLWSILLG
jgi:hypothetical protein